MTLAEIDHARTSDGTPLLKVVLCGSFRRDALGLRGAFEQLDQRFEILSPRSLDFINPGDQFVRLADEVSIPAGIVEERHLQAMSDADLIWLHCPDGYVGTSAAMELGHAQALGIPVFSDTLPEDEVLAGTVHYVAHPGDIDSGRLELVARPGEGLERLQRYYRTAAARRGWDNESARDTLLLITEEIGELARAIRKNRGLARHHPGSDVDISTEVADVQLYLVHLANILELDLAEAVTLKEGINAARFNEVRVA